MKQKSIFKDILKLVTGVICTAGIATMAGIAVYFTIPSAKDKIDKHFKWNDYSNTQIENLAKISDYESQIKDLNSKKVDYENQIKDLNSKKSEYEIELKKLNDEKTADKNKILELNTKIIDCENKIEDLNSKLTTVTKQIENFTINKAYDYDSFGFYYSYNNAEQHVTVRESNSDMLFYTSKDDVKIFATGLKELPNILTQSKVTLSNYTTFNINYSSEEFPRSQADILNNETEMNSPLCNISYSFNDEEKTFDELMNCITDDYYNIRYSINFDNNQNILNVKMYIQNA